MALTCILDKHKRFLSKTWKILPTPNFWTTCILLQTLRNYIIITFLNVPCLYLSSYILLQTSLCCYKQLKLFLAAYSTGQECGVPWNTSSCFLESLEGKMKLSRKLFSAAERLYQLRYLRWPRQCVLNEVTLLASLYDCMGKNEQQLDRDWGRWLELH